MAKMIKNLSKNVVNKDSRFHLREDLDFTDDGSKFRGFDYNGMPITTLREGGFTYLSIRVDYLDTFFTIEDWMETEEYKLCDEFNCVEEINLDKLIDNCERIIAKVKELDDMRKNQTYETKEIINQLLEEKRMALSVLEEAKTSVKWWKLDKIDLNYVKDAFNGLSGDISIIEDLINKIENHSLNKRKLIYYYINMKRDGYIKIHPKSYSIQRLKEAMQ